MGKDDDSLTNAEAVLNDRVNYVDYTIELYQNEKYADFLEASELAIKKCEEDGRLDEIALILYSKGITYRILGEHTKALRNFFMSIEHYQTIGERERGLCFKSYWINIPVAGQLSWSIGTFF